MTHYNYGQDPYNDYELEEKGRWPSQGSMISGSHPSLYSAYTPSTSTYILPIAQELPDLNKKTPDHMGFAICSFFCNPIFGILAVLVSEQAKAYYYRCNYIKARQYGQFAKGLALGGIISTIILLILIGMAAFHHHRRFYMW